MRKRFKKGVALLMSTVMILSFTACGKEEEKETSTTTDEAAVTKELTLLMGETYCSPDWDSSVKLSGTSEDESIAELCFGKFIQGHAAGKTTVKVDTGDGIEVYNITVKEDESRARAGKEIKNYSVYIGCGYNALTASIIPTNNDVNAQKPMIYAKVVDSYLSSDENNLLYIGEQTSQYKEVKSNNVDTMADNYNTTISGGLGLELPAFGKLEAKGKYSDIKNTTTDENYYLTTISRYLCKRTYILNCKEQTVTEMAMENKVFWDKLTGNTDPLKIFEDYGTHMIISVNLGGRIELDYMLHTNNSKVNNSQLLDVSGKIEAKISSVNASVEGGYFNEEKQEMSKSNISSRFEATILGGKGISINSIDDYPKQYLAWEKSMEKEKNWAFIGIPKNGLVAVWDLLPDEYSERAEEIRKAYEDEVNKKIEESNKKTEESKNK